MGGSETPAPAGVEPTVKYHPYYFGILTSPCISREGTVAGGQFDWGGCLNLEGRPDGNIRGKPGCMLGSPVYLAVLPEGSENLTSADNQQGSSSFSEPLNDYTPGGLEERSMI